MTEDIPRLVDTGAVVQDVLVEETAVEDVAYEGLAGDSGLVGLVVAAAGLHTSLAGEAAQESSVGGVAVVVRLQVRYLADDEGEAAVALCGAQELTEVGEREGLVSRLAVAPDRVYMEALHKTGDAVGQGQTLHGEGEGAVSAGALQDEGVG